MRVRRMEMTARWLLWVQLALTVAALVLAGVSLTSSPTTTSGMTVVGGAMVSTPVIACGVLLVAAAVLGLVALRRHSLYLRSGIVLLAPLVLAGGTSLSGLPEEDEAGVQVLSTYDVWSSLQETLRLLEWASMLVFGAVVVAALAAVLLLRLRHTD